MIKLIVLYSYLQSAEVRKNKVEILSFDTLEEVTIKAIYEKLFFKGKRYPEILNIEQIKTYAL